MLLSFSESVFTLLTFDKLNVDHILQVLVATGAYHMLAILLNAGNDA